MTTVDTDGWRVLLAIEEIKQLKARYCRLIDEKRWSDWSEVIHPDCRLRVGERGSVVTGREAIVSYVSEAFGEGLTVHHIHNPEIEVLSTWEARGVWALADYVNVPSRSNLQFRGFGHYYEEYARFEARGWTIKSIRVRYLRRDPLDA